MKAGTAGLAMLLASGLLAPLAAQAAPGPLPPVRGWFGAQLVGAVPVGEFADYIDGGGGLALNGQFPVKVGSPLSVRADLGWVLYGSETMKVCFQSTGCRVTLDLTTTNNIFFFNFGPQLTAPAGPLRPYLNGSGGFAYFATTSSVKGDDNSENFASDTNYDDFALSWGVGGGLLIPVARGKTPVLIDLGAQYHGNGYVEYLTEGDIHEQPSGPPLLDPKRSEGNFVSIRLGVSIGIRPGAQQ